MTLSEKMQLCLMAASVALTVAAVVWLITAACCQKESLRGCLLRFLACFFPGIWCMKLAAGLYMMQKTPIADASGLSAVEVFFDSAVHSLQAFSMDEDYTLYLQAGRLQSLAITGSGLLSGGIGLLIAMQNLAAPIAGGAILLDLFCNFFPRLRFFLQTGKEKYVFSELNERTVFLAESIRRSQQERKKASILFTDAYTDAANEKRSELLQRARQIGGICLKDDLKTIRIRGRKKVTYILADEEETANLNDVFWIARHSDTLCAKVSGVDVYCFSQDGSADGAVKQIYNEKTGISKEEARRVVIKVVRDAQSLIYRLLYQRPLFLPLLLSEERAEGLSVLIVGSGPVAREMLAISYWCGQLCDSGTGKLIPLTIHVIAGKNGTEMKKDLELKMPGVDFDGKDSCCRFCFYECQAGNSEIGRVFEQHQELYDSNYILVALEDDTASRNTAEWLHRNLDLHNLGRNRCALIHYVIEDSYLCDSLNRAYGNDDGFSRYYAFGSIAERFSEESVFASRLEKQAFEINHKHNEVAEREFQKDGYLRRSSCAAVLHVPCKVFSADRTLFSVSGNGLHAGNERIADAVNRSRDLLAWLEHRRWGTYMLSDGYQCPSKEVLETYFMGIPDKLDAKYTTLRLHPCIVFDVRPGLCIRQADWEQEKIDTYDELDNFSLAFNQMLRRKFHSDWESVCCKRELVERLLLSELDEEGRMRDMYGCRDLLEENGLSPVQAMLAVPTNYKQHDYDILRVIPQIMQEYSGMQEQMRMIP